MARAWRGSEGADVDTGMAGNGMLSQRNAERLAEGLCRMRGAALKLGQMLSIQDENVLPKPIAEALERVRAGEGRGVLLRLEG